MEEGDSNNSWIRRAKFSNTIYHRANSNFPLPIESLSFKNRLPAVTKSKSDASIAFNDQVVRKGISSLDSSLVCPSSHIPRDSITNKQRTVSPVPKTNVSDTFKDSSSGCPSSQILRSPNTTKQRSVSPVLKTKLCDTFKEARSELKRFSTPHPQRKQPDNKVSPKRDLSWTKYFDHGSGSRVTSVETHDESKLDFSKLSVGPKFAHGAHSQLHQGSYMNKPVAVKITYVPVNHQDVDGEGEGDDKAQQALLARLENQFNREVSILSRLHHENVIKFVAAGKKTSAFYIITEYLPEGSLRLYLHKLEKKEESIPLKKLIGIGLDIARGMEYVHSQGIIHRDLKPENVLITQDFRMEVADFGIASEGSSQYDVAEDLGTYRWMAPEMMKRKRYSKKVDVYSFGLILWEMVAGTIPYKNMIPVQVAFAVANKNMRPVIPEKCPAPMRALIEQCWSTQPEKRPEFWQIVKVLEQFEISLASDGILAPLINLTSQDHKKGLLRWIHKLGATRSTTFTPLQKPRLL